MVPMPSLPTPAALTAARARVSECAAECEALRNRIAREERYRREHFDMEADCYDLIRLERAQDRAEDALASARAALATLEDAAENGAEDHWHAVQDCLCA